MRFADKLPDQDAYSHTYCIIVDAINNIDSSLRDLKPSLKEAKKEVQSNPDQEPCRARMWCAYHDPNNPREEDLTGAESEPQ